MSEAQMHGKSHRPIANKCANLEQYERWAKQYIDGDLAASEKGMKVKVTIDTSKNYAVNNGLRQILGVAVEADQKLFYAHLVKAVQTYKPPGSKKKATTVEHTYWFDVTAAVNPKRLSAIEKANKIHRMKPEKTE